MLKFMGCLLTFFIGFMLFMVVLMAVGFFKARNILADMWKQEKRSLQQAEERRRHTTYGRQEKPNTSTTQSRVFGDEGEYVDFEEVK